MKLVAGLGNPGSEYTGTRHNVGYEVVDVIAKRHGAAFDFADMNRDGVLDQQDVNLYFDVYFRNDCDPKTLADVRLYSC